MHNAKRDSQAELPSATKLLGSTILAAVGAAAILVAVVLPSEYGIDPTGAGRVLGLTNMGETKMQLAAEAEADRATADDKTTSPAPAPAPVPDLSGLYERITALEGAVRDLTRAIETTRTASVAPAPQEQVTATTAAGAVAPKPDTITNENPPQDLSTAAPESQAEKLKQHDTSFVLKPGQGIEIKLVMKKGAKADFAWASKGGPVNFDTHGDGEGDLKISYEKGRGVQSDEGTITAEFDGNHGWFWRNRNQKSVTLTLRTEGDYADIKGLPN
jgi:hypothetical protein